TATYTTFFSIVLPPFLLLDRFVSVRCRSPRAPDRSTVEQAGCRSHCSLRRRGLPSCSPVRHVRLSSRVYLCDPTRRRNVPMDEREWLAERFEEHRTRLRAVAYRMLGSLSEADDAVQEAWLRLNRTDASGVENLGAWLTTVVARISLNMLRSRKTRSEQPLAEGLPDVIIDRADRLDPEHEALLADS